jgi:sigma-B regulation protein RsbU (phosphoserine phosphatase)
MTGQLKAKLRHLGKVEKTFCVLLLLYLALALLRSGSILVPLTQFVLIILGGWIMLRLTRIGMRKAIWRLRNRLLVTYLFIALIPVLLIVTLAGLGGYAMFNQLAVYLASSELERRVDSLRFIAETLAQTNPAERQDVAASVGAIHRQRFPDLTIAVATPSSRFVWPKADSEPDWPEGWKEAKGLVLRKGRHFAWSHLVQGATNITVRAPLTRAYLSQMVPGLGDVALVEISEERAGVKTAHESPATPLPPPANRLDIDLHWISFVPVARWDTPGKMDLALMAVHTRPSAVLATIINTKADVFQGSLPIILFVIAILFLIVEIAALIIGVSLTRTITRAVHNLYGGTQRVIEGDFSHRITVHGKDQLAELSTSFNTMTENLERLLAVAKEKERLQAELEIAREVQEQLYPKTTPSMRTLRLMATCEPARMVSGDYYDYQCLADNRLALAIGDVAGKGISAALLMATIQAAMRMQLRSSMASAAPSSQSRAQFGVSPARLVSDLNEQLYATTSPEKYATFFFAFYDETTGELSYTNAGHLPPYLVHNGSAAKLEVNGTVVGAFPFSKYEQSAVQMETGDLLVCYTDGITEPENAYGEMFGEERMIDLVVKNWDRDEGQIVSMIIDAVRQWTTATEQPDDMTLLLARKI